MNQSIIAQLKQTNVSIDIEKTQERTENLWKSIDTVTQKKVLEFLGLKVTSIYRAYRTGKISAKIIVALSQVCNINPYYLTGESDEPSESSDEILKKFLIEEGYGKLFNTSASSKKRGRRKGNTVYVKIPVETADEESQKEPSVYTQPDKASQSDITASIIELFLSQYDNITSAQLESMQNLSLEDMDTLMKALLIRAKTVNKSATIETLVKLLLIS